MDLSPGMRVRVVNQPYEPFEGTYVGPEGGETIPEGGGDLFIPNDRVRMDNGNEVVVPRPAITPLSDVN